MECAWSQNNIFHRKHDILPIGPQMKGDLGLLHHCPIVSSLRSVRMIGLSAADKRSLDFRLGC